VSLSVHISHCTITFKNKSEFFQVIVSEPHMTLVLLLSTSCQCIQKTQESTLARQLTSWEQPHHPSNLMSNVSGTLKTTF
jgi:hypothetical protein